MGGKGDSWHLTQEPLLRVFSLAGKEGTTFFVPGQSSTDFQRRFQSRAGSGQEAFLRCMHIRSAPHPHPVVFGDLSALVHPAFCLVLGTGLLWELVAWWPGFGVLSLPAPGPGGTECLGQAEGADEERRLTQAGPWT